MFLSVYKRAFDSLGRSVVYVRKKFFPTGLWKESWSVEKAGWLRSSRVRNKGESRAPGNSQGLDWGRHLEDKFSKRVQNP